MSLEFSRHPGAYERHLQRCAGNPLFGPKRRQVIQIEITQAQRRDSEDAALFLKDFRTLVQRAVDLKPQEDSEVVLKLKEDLDRAYEQCCGLPGERGDIKAALRKLIGVVMQAVWRGAENDPGAQANLREEEAARRLHFELLEEALVADLIRPDSPIAQDELAPTLLSESEAAVAAALTLFDADQLTLLCADAARAARGLPEDSPWVGRAQARLRQMETHLRTLQSDLGSDTV
ncbi:MAG: hypothetical protein LOY58_13580 [Gammaproteobacteria bacterium]|nr:hypothetical protein [Gammaproteobacteria bacterium]